LDLETLKKIIEDFAYKLYERSEFLYNMLKTITNTPDMISEEKTITNLRQISKQIIDIGNELEKTLEK